MYPRLTYSFAIPLALAFALTACKPTESQPVARKQSLAPRRQALVAPADGETAQFFAPSGLAVDSDGRKFDSSFLKFPYLLVADTLNHIIRRVDLVSGATTVFAGTPGVQGATETLFNRPSAVAIAGNVVRTWPSVEQNDVFVADSGNHTIRWIYDRWDPETDAVVHKVETIGGQAGVQGHQDCGSSLFKNPQGIAVGEVVFSSWDLVALTDNVYVADTGNSVIRRIALPARTVTTIAGAPGQHGHADGAGAAARFNRPTGLVYTDGKLYVADTGNHVIRAIDVRAGNFAVTTVAGAPGQYGSEDGSLSAARFAQPVGVALAEDPKTLLVTDRAAYVLRSVLLNPATGAPRVETIAGRAFEQGSQNAGAATSRFRAPTGVGQVGGVTYVADRGNNLIRRIATGAEGTTVATMTGTLSPGNNDGWPEALRLGTPAHVACDSSRIYFKGGLGIQVAELDAARTGAIVRTVGPSQDGPFALAFGVLHTPHDYSLERIKVADGTRSFQLGGTQFFDTVVTMGSRLMVWSSDGEFGDWNRLDSYTADGATSEVIGETNGSPPRAATDGTYLYWVGEGGFARLDPAHPAARSAVATQPFGAVESMAVAGGSVYITTPGRRDVRRVDLGTGAVTTFAGSNGPSSPFVDPNGLCVSGAELFVADGGAPGIKKVSLSNGDVLSLSLRRP